MTTTIPFGRMTCPQCIEDEKIDFTSAERSYRAMAVHDCHGEGTIPDPYYGSDPSAIIAAAKPGEDVLRKWAQEFQKWWGDTTVYTPQEWITYFENTKNDTMKVGHTEAASILRCLIGPNPRTVERVGCPECHGLKRKVILKTGPQRGPEKKYVVRPPVGVLCKRCKGVGTIPKPLDPRWLTSSVLDLARAIRGMGKPIYEPIRASKCSCGGRLIERDDMDNVRDGHLPKWCQACWAVQLAEHAGYTKDDPQLDRLPILADELQAAFCEDKEILRHCYDDKCHVADCWLLKAILDSP